MADSLLTEKDKAMIKILISQDKPDEIIKILQNISTLHAGTAKTKDKRFIISEIVKHAKDNLSGNPKYFFEAGKKFCRSKSDNAKEIGVSLIWRGYIHKPAVTEEILLKIADDPNWEVREYAGTAFANVLKENPALHGKILEWSEHTSENVRRAVVFSSLAYKQKGDITKAFEILKPLMSDNSQYVKKNLGPFILGSHFGNNFPEETLEFLKSLVNEKCSNTLWNIAMSFNNSFGNRFPEDSLQILSKMMCSENPVVRRAVISTLRHLHKRHPEKVDNFCHRYKISIKKASPRRGG